MCLCVSILFCRFCVRVYACVHGMYGAGNAIAQENDVCDREMGKRHTFFV